jgi:hypothetical protein
MFEYGVPKGDVFPMYFYGNATVMLMFEGSILGSHHPGLDGSLNESLSLDILPSSPCSPLTFAYTYY